MCLSTSQSIFFNAFFQSFKFSCIFFICHFCFVYKSISQPNFRGFFIIQSIFCIFVYLAVKFSSIFFIQSVFLFVCVFIWLQGSQIFMYFLPHSQFSLFSLQVSKNFVCYFFFTSQSYFHDFSLLVSQIFMYF